MLVHDDQSPWASTGAASHLYLDGEIVDPDEVAEPTEEELLQILDDLQGNQRGYVANLVLYQRPVSEQNLVIHACHG